jgi:putative flippase GtrA
MPELRTFGGFVVAGAIAAAANYGSRFVLSNWVSFPAAVTLAYLVGMTVAFVLMRNYVFAARNGSLGPQVIWFAIVNVLALAQTLVVSLVLAQWLLPAAGIVDQAEAIGHAVGVAVPVVSSYFGHRWRTFR